MDNKLIAPEVRFYLDFYLDLFWFLVDQGPSVDWLKNVCGWVLSVESSRLQNVFQRENKKKNQRNKHGDPNMEQNSLQDI